jgi:c-di-GMP-binding flagellar brake protein YcgR/ActR/RegA family two-component response regulator
MALFSFGKDGKKEGGDPNVMAYLEDALRIKAPAMLIDPHKNELPCNIASIKEEEGTLNLQLHANLLAEKGAKVGLIVIVDNMRIYGSSRLHEVKPGHAMVDIPSSLEISERRKKQRAKVNPREGTTATLLSGLFDGIGITGLVDNLSEGGVRVKVENAIEIKTEKKINITGRTLKTGQIFPIVKLSKIPRSVVTIECAGRMVYVQVDSGVTYIGLAFEEFKSEYARVIEGFVSGRSSPPPTSLPPRARRGKEETAGPHHDPHSGKEEGADKDKDKDPKDKDPKDKDSKEKDHKEKEPKEDKHKDEHWEAPPPEPPAAGPSDPTVPVPAPQVAQAAAQPDAADGHARPVPTPLQKLKRRTRTIVLCGTDDDLVSSLEKAFQHEGYGKVLCPKGIEEIIGSAPQGGTGIIVLALDIPFDNCLDLARSIQAQIPDHTPMVLISDDIPPGVGAAHDAQSAGIALLLRKNAKIDDAVFAKLEEIMGITG